jgi:ABC-type multidrug transport system fused ATPase/permease subunit
MRACKLSVVALISALFCLTICVSLSTNIWLSKWTDKGKMGTGENTTSSSSWTTQTHDMSIYSVLGIAQGFLIFAMQLIQKLAAYSAGRHLHWIILIGVLHAPVSFFDTTPIGRIINRFAKEMESVDTALPNAVSQVITTLVTVITTLIILIYGSWLAILQLIPLAIVFAYIQV